jgi:hypothetical protein
MCIFGIACTFGSISLVAEGACDISVKMCILALMKGGGLKKMRRGLVRGGKDLTTSLHVIIHHHSPLSFYTILNR